LGISNAALQRYVSEENMPPFDVIARLCAATGVRMEWLAWNKAPMKEGPGVSETAPQSQSQAVRYDVLTVAIQLAEEALEGRTLPTEKRAELVGLIYEMLEEGLPNAKVLRFARAAMK
jgi:transcriptional regulator with XRE-family HTH domain